VKYKPEDGTWIVRKDATGLEEIRNELGAEEYDKQKLALQKFLCDYFSTGACISKLGASISPVSGAPKGGKALKVRWGLPGSGKSGGIRLIVVVFCAEKKAVVTCAFKRKDL
jgi:hypothetical protein